MQSRLRELVGEVSNLRRVRSQPDCMFAIIYNPLGSKLPDITNVPWTLKPIEYMDFSLLMIALMISLAEMTSVTITRPYSP